MLKKIQIAFLILITALISCSNKENEKFLNDVSFEEGDLVFRKGIGTKSQAVTIADYTGVYSHIGIVVKCDSAFKIIHIVPDERKKGETEDFIKIESLEEFFSDKRATNGAVYRLKDFSIYGKKASIEAKRLLEKKIIFDDKYNLNDSTKMYCTEFVWYVYNLFGKDITCGKRVVLKTKPFAGIYIFPSNIFTNEDILLINKY